MGNGFAPNNEFNPWLAQQTRSLSDAVLKLPAYRQRGYEQGQRAGLMQLQGDTERAQADNYRATAGKTKVETEREQYQLYELMTTVAKLKEKGLMRTDDAGNLILDAQVGNDLLAGAVSQAKGTADLAGAVKISDALLAPQEAQKDRGAAMERTQAGIDSRERIAREKPAPSPSTAQADSNAQRFWANVKMKVADGSITEEQGQAMLDEYRQRFTPPDATGTNAPAAQPAAPRTAAPGYVVGAVYKGGLKYLGGDINDVSSWQKVQ